MNTLFYTDRALDPDWIRIQRGVWIRIQEKKEKGKTSPHFYAAPGINFDAAPAPTLLYSKAKFLKRTKV
jgi:hypothetical protein